MIKVNDCPAGLENWLAGLEPPTGARNRRKATVIIWRDQTDEVQSYFQDKIITFLTSIYKINLFTINLTCIPEDKWIFKK